MSSHVQTDSSAKDAQDMNSFGEILRTARTVRNMSQAEMGRALGDLLSRMTSSKTAGPVQSYIARLEAGRVEFPDREIMEALACLFDLPYEQLLGALMSDRYGQKGRTELFYPLMKGMLTLPELAAWEASETHVETWVVVGEYLDDRRPDFREAVLSILRQQHTITFFMASGLGQLVAMYRSELSKELGRTVTADEVQYVPLDVVERALLVSPFVLTSETGLTSYDHTPKPMGYQLLTDDRGEPHVAIKLSQHESLERYRALKVLHRQLRKAA